ncbi:MAG: hypothetical protein QXR60_02465 [Candidatus Nanoarchaeia archaeon]
MKNASTKEVYSFVIKEVKPSGNAGHIPMGKKDVGKRFIIIPENQKYLLNEFVKSLKDILNPKLSEYFTKGDMQIIKNAYKERISEIRGMYAGIHKKLLEGELENINNFRISEIPTILNRVGGHLSKEIKNRLLKEYYRQHS